MYTTDASSSSSSSSSSSTIAFPQACADGYDGERAPLLQRYHADEPYTAKATSQKITPLPRLPMLVLSFCIFSEPLSSTILLPFIYFMVRDFHLTNDDKEIGFYAGTIASAYFLAQFLTSILWGHLSDRYGRKPILLIGLLSNTFTMIMFGMSKSLWVAVLARCLCGALNGNVGVSKSVLGEITDSTNQPMAFALFGFCWGIGGIAGPVLGGLLSWPADQFPDLFGHNAFLIYFPYFLPCLISAIISLLGFIVGYFFFNETHPHILALRDAERRASTSSPASFDRREKNEMRELGSIESGRHHRPTTASLDIRRAHPRMQLLVQDLAGSVSTTASTLAEIASGFGVVAHEDDESVHSEEEEDGDPLYLVMTEANDRAVVVSEAWADEEVAAVVWENEEIAGNLVMTAKMGEDNVTTIVMTVGGQEEGKKKKIGKVSMGVILAYTILAFHCMIFDELFNLYAVALPSIGGLGWTARNLAISLALMGIVQLVAQFVLYPCINHYVKTMTLYRWSLMWYIPVYMLCPVIASLADVWGKGGDAWVWYAMLVVLTVRFCLTTISYTAVMLMINNSANSDMLGTVNGFGQTSASFVRAVGPALGGTLWSWSLTNNASFPFNNWFIFFVMSGLTLIGYVQSLPLPESVGEAREGEQVVHLGYTELCSIAVYLLSTRLL
ncbi:major facilitator superfamily domain-containing protein [Endogone sp. FLAS-F59071]|nr:major facilitator superfamily domain-containing protein [Endogone sp. FLAS-F59071]|eukprot:RUS16332.1 major facilitator superfamily domain-containing protein [Endogone sp. FLAS-F59071]